VLGLVLIIGASFAIPLWTGRARYPQIERQMAGRAIEDARKDDADHWAPERFSSAVTAFKAGVEEGLRQRRRPIPFQNYALAEDQFYCAARNAFRAIREGKSVRVSMASRAAEMMDLAQDAISQAEGSIRIVPVGMIPRLRLQESRTHLSEAAVLTRDRRFDDAYDHAKEAQAGALWVLSQTGSAASRYLDSSVIRQWRNWIDATLAESRNSQGEAIIVFKEKNRLDLYHAGRLRRSYHADMGRNRLSPKLYAGDRATPEGRYFITKKKGRGDSKYYMALVLNYPNDEDRRRLAQAKTAGLASNRMGLGGLIEIHGEGGRGEDWTYGCVALANDDLNDLFSRVSVGTPVTIVGGDGQSGKFSDLARRLSAPPQ
jgi:L,D-transpeptidase-like protein